MFPFISPYLHMMQRNRLSIPGMTLPDQTPWDNTDDEEESGAFGQRPWDVDAGNNSTGEGAGSRRRGLYSGLTALGVNLLDAAPRGDYAGGLARGAAAFSEAYGGSMDRDRQLARERREEERQAAADARAERQEGRSVESHTLGMETGRAQLDDVQERRRIAQETRARSGKGAEQMAADIRGLAAAHPDNKKLQTMAQRAAGYAVGDEDDVDKLTTLHGQMTDEAFWQSDTDRAADAKINLQTRERDLGLANDPRRDDARADRQLGLEERRLNLYEAQGGPDGGTRGPKAPTPAQRTDDILAEARRILSEKKKAAESRGDIILPGTEQKWRAEAMAEATRTIDELYRSGITVDANGNPIR